MGRRCMFNVRNMDLRLVGRVNWNRANRPAASLRSEEAEKGGSRCVFTK